MADSTPAPDPFINTKALFKVLNWQWLEDITTKFDIQDDGDFIDLLYHSAEEFEELLTSLPAKLKRAKFHLRKLRRYAIARNNGTAWMGKITRDEF